MGTFVAEQDVERRLGIWLAFAFGCVFVTVLLALALTGNTLDDQRFEIFRIVLALAGGGIGGGWSGQVHSPWLGHRPEARQAPRR
jgi:hypothetical protein